MGESLIVRRGGGGSNVKNVQQSSLISIGAGTLTSNVTFSAVDTESTIPIVYGYPNSNPNSTFPTIYTATASFTSSTNLLLTRINSSATATFIAFAIELKDLKSFQRGSGTISSGVLIITIDPVDTSKTVVLFNKAGASGIAYRLTSSTSLRFDQSVNPSAVTQQITYCVAEFK